LVIYGGLGYLVAQWAFLARLTWWEFNWDIMEPVTYFVTFGTAILGYFYFALLKRDYSYQDLRETVYWKRLHGNFRRKQFDAEKYYDLENKLKQTNPELFKKIEDEVEANK